MNRDAGRLQPAPSSNYLLIFFAFSVCFLFCMPYLSPLTSLLPQLGTRLLVHIFHHKKNTRSPPTYQSANLLAERPATQTPDLVSERPLLLDRTPEALERIVLDLQRILQIERERMLHMEHELRLLRMSENFLQDRVRSLEERPYGGQRDAGGSSSSIELLLQHTESVQRNQANLNNLVRDLSKMVHAEKDRTSSLTSEVSLLRGSEARLAERVKALEEKLLSSTSSYERRLVFDRQNDYDGADHT